MKRKNTLNNIMMENSRKNPLYQTIVTDLCIEGLMARDVAESLLGYEIPGFLKTPSGKSLQESAAGVPQKEKRKGDAPDPSPDAKAEEKDDRGSILKRR